MASNGNGNDTTARPKFADLEWFIVAALAVAVILFHRVGTERAYDIFGDEVNYLRLSEHVLKGEPLELYGTPFFIHPFIFFLVQAVYLLIVGPVDSYQDVYNAVYLARGMNAFISGLTFVAVYGIGRAAAGWKAGALGALIFFIDPFVVRINNRNMLESLAVLPQLVAFWIVAVNPARVDGRRAVVVGLLIGLSLLTKEMMFYSLIILAAATWWVGVPTKRGVTIVVITAAAVYAIYPLWAIASGQFGDYMAVKLQNVRRFLGLRQEAGFNRAPGSFLIALIQGAGEFLGSYATYALGLAAAVYLGLRTEPKLRWLGVWGAVVYGYFAFIVVFGALEDQFFYFLTIPALLLVAVAAVTLFENPIGTLVLSPVQRAAAAQPALLPEPRLATEPPPTRQPAMTGALGATYRPRVEPLKRAGRMSSAAASLRAERGGREAEPRRRHGAQPRPPLSTRRPPAGPLNSSSDNAPERH